MRNIAALLTLFLILCLLSCQKENPEEASFKEVEFSLGGMIKSNKSAANLDDGDPVPSSILVTILDSDGDEVYNREPIDILRFGDAFVSEKINLLEGNFSLSEFFVLDADGKIVYAAPKEGSAFAQLVNDPLNIDFNTVDKEITEVQVEVLKAEYATPDKFGYGSFELNIVGTIDIQVAISAYDYDTEQLQLTTAELTVTDNEGNDVSISLGDSTNVVRLRDDLATYHVTIEKSGYEQFEATYYIEEISTFKAGINSLKVTLLESFDPQTIFFKSVIDNDLSGFSYKMTEMNDGNILIAGAKFAQNGDWNSTILCINPSGDKVWEYNELKLGAKDDQHAVNVIQASNGNIYGLLWRANKDDATKSAIVELSIDGTLLNRHEITIGNNEAYGFIETDNNQLVISGNTNNSNDMLVQVYGLDGTLRSQKEYAGKGLARDIIELDNGNFITSNGIELSPDFNLISSDNQKFSSVFESLNGYLFTNSEFITNGNIQSTKTYLGSLNRDGILLSSKEVTSSLTTQNSAGDIVKIMNMIIVEDDNYLNIFSSDFGFAKQLSIEDYSVWSTGSILHSNGDVYLMSNNWKLLRLTTD